MKKGDYVMSLGDTYMSKGSLGIVTNIGSFYIRLIKWYDIKDTKNISGVQLYHEIDNLKLILDAPINPNVAFLHKKEKEKQNINK